MPDSVYGFRGLRNFESNRPAVASRSARGSTDRSSLIEHPAGAIVKNGQLEDGRSIRYNEIRTVLAIHPVRRVSSIDSEIALVAESPNDITPTTPLFVIDLDDPVLMGQGQQNVPVIGGIEQGTGMGPIGREKQRVPVNVQVVKGGPDPDG